MKPLKKFKPLKKSKLIIANEKTAPMEPKIMTKKAHPSAL